MFFEILGAISGIETIAQGRAIRERKRLARVYGKGRWRKKKGLATLRLADDTICKAEIHWYEAHGIGQKEFKIKQIID